MPDTSSTNGHAPPRPGSPIGDPSGAATGTAVCKWLYAAVKLGGLWGYDGKVAREAIEGLVAALRENGARRGRTIVRVASEQVFLDDERLPIDFAGFLAFRFVVDLFVSRKIGEIRFAPSPTEREVVALLTALNGVPRNCDDPRKELDRALVASGVVGITLGAPRDIEEKAEDRRVASIRDASVETYFRAVFVAKQLLDPVDPERVVDVRKAKRVIHALADLLDQDEATLLALVQLKNFAGFRATHAANVAVLAMSVARRLALPRKLLGDLGVAAMLAGAGTDGGPGSENADAGPAASDDRRARAARRLAQGMAFSDCALRVVIAARRHGEDALHDDGPGAPLVHRILRIAEFYDTATTPAGPGAPSVEPQQALALLTRDPRRFDARLVKVLASIVGRYPLGTLVRLDTGESAVVCGRNPHFAAPTRPIVRVITGDDGEEIAEPRTVDLSKWDRGRGCFARSIVQSFAPSAVYDDPAAYIRTI
jgi:hypothetical protein